MDAVVVMYPAPVQSRWEQVLRMQMSSISSTKEKAVISESFHIFEKITRNTKGIDVQSYPLC